MSDTLRDQVRDRYAQAAREVSAKRSVSCCGDDGGCGDDAAGVFGSDLYRVLSKGEVPAAAVTASFGCGDPTTVADLREGEVVLDLGSGGGLDVLLSARRVGPGGKAYGLDMTDEMLELAERSRLEAGIDNAEFMKGHIEEVPLPDASVDVIVSNCVINLSVDKPKVFSEMFRVLREGGRIGVSDVVGDDHLSPADRAERGSYVGCIAGALSFSEYRDGLGAAGFSEVTVEATHQVAEGMHATVIKATKPWGSAASRS